MGYQNVNSNMSLTSSKKDTIICPAHFIFDLTYILKIQHYAVHCRIHIYLMHEYTKHSMSLFHGPQNCFQFSTHPWNEKCREMLT